MRRSHPAPLQPPTVPLVAWLEAHGLTYGVAGYFDASIVTMQSGNMVRIRSVNMGTNKVQAATYETNALWYDASRYDARFVVADGSGSHTVGAFERDFGRPAATYQVDSWFVLIYRTNLLRQVQAPRT